jgi:hypothetical protein
MQPTETRAPAFGLSIGRGYFNASGLYYLNTGASIAAIGGRSDGHWILPEARTPQTLTNQAPDAIHPAMQELDWDEPDLSLLAALAGKVMKAAMVSMPSATIRLSVALPTVLRRDPIRRQDYLNAVCDGLLQHNITLKALNVIAPAQAIAVARWHENPLRFGWAQPHGSITDRIGVIDVGYYGSSVALIEAGQLIAEAPVAWGMSDALETIRQIVATEYGQEFSRRAMDEQLVRFPGRGIWKPNGYSLPLPDAATDALQTGAPELLAAGQQLWGAAERLDRVLLGGGGAWAVAPALFAALPRLEIPLSNYLLEHQEQRYRSGAGLQNDIRNFMPQWICAIGAAYHAHLDGQVGVSDELPGSSGPPQKNSRFAPTASWASCREASSFPAAP